MAEMLDNIEKHQIPEHMIQSGEVEKWRFPWVLEDPVSFIDPVPYEHPSGAVIWVQLAKAVSHQIDQRLQSGNQHFVREVEPRGRKRLTTGPDRAAPLSEILALMPEENVKPQHSGSSSVSCAIIGRTSITEGNLKNNHIYLRGFIEEFPSDAIGGSNRNARANASVYVRWEESEWHETDLDGQKLFFRSRSMVRKFFEESGAKVGDVVEIERTGPYYFQLRLQKRGE